MEVFCSLDILFTYDLLWCCMRQKCCKGTGANFVPQFLGLLHGSFHGLSMCIIQGSLEEQN